MKPSEWCYLNIPGMSDLEDPSVNSYMLPAHSGIVRPLKDRAFENITYLGQFIEESWELRAITHIKYRIEGAHYYIYGSGLNSISCDEKTDSPLFDILGSRLSSTPQRGIYIRDGKIILIH